MRMPGPIQGSRADDDDDDDNDDEQYKVKVKQSYYRPEQTLRVPGGLFSQVS